MEYELPEKLVGELAKHRVALNYVASERMINALQEQGLQSRIQDGLRNDEPRGETN